MEEAKRAQLAKDLEGIVGAKFVATEDFHRWAYAIGEWISVAYPPIKRWDGGEYAPPDIIVKPQTTEQVSEIMKLANETKTPVIVRGGAEGNAAGPTPLKQFRGIVLDMTDMQKIIGYDEISRCVRFEAGTKWGKLHDYLKKKGLYMGFMGPHGMLGAALGGSIALNTVGVGGAKYGQENENVLTLKVVLPTGEIIKTGSRSNKVAQWYHRYCNGPDLAGIFLGSCGAFGVITEVAYKAYPLPPFEITKAHYFPDDAAMARSVYEADSYDYLYEYIGVGAYGLTEDLLPSLTGMRGAPINISVLNAYDEDILRKQEEAVDNIVKKHHGKELPVKNLMSAIGMSMADTNELGGGGIAKLAGGVPEKTCSLLPILMVPKMNKACADFFEKHNDALITHPLLGKKAWAVAWLSGSNHGIATTITALIGDPSTPESRQAFYDLWHESLEAKWDAQTCAYWIGKDAHWPHLEKRFDPTYVEFMNKIKRALDPNNIMNPGVIGLGVEASK